MIYEDGKTFFIPLNKVSSLGIYLYLKKRGILDGSISRDFHSNNAFISEANMNISPSK